MGLGMNVAVRPLRWATFFTMCLNHIRLSAHLSKLSKRMSISPCAALLVVADLDLDAQALQLQVDLGAQIHVRVLGLDRKVALLTADLVAEIRTFLAPAVPHGLAG